MTCLCLLARPASFPESASRLARRKPLDKADSELGPRNKLSQPADETIPAMSATNLCIVHPSARGPWGAYLFGNAGIVIGMATSIWCLS